MKISEEAKDFLVGFPIVLIIAAVVIWLITIFGTGALFVSGAFMILCFIGAIVGSYIRYAFRIWE